MALHPDLAGRVALVTGGGRGIGKAIALTLAEAGAEVAVNYRERADAAEATAEQIRRLGRRAAVVQADVARAPEVERLVDAVARALGPVDILVNNAGIAEPCELEQLSEEVFARTLAVNLNSAFLCSQAVLPGMRARGFGRIVNISSGAARGAGVVGVALQRVEGGHRGPDPGLCRPRGPGRGHRQRGRPVADRDRDDQAAPQRQRRQDPARPARHRGRDRERRADGGRQRLHDRPDRRRQRRPALQLQGALPATWESSSKS